LSVNPLENLIVLTLLQTISKSGSYYSNIVGFIDGTIRPICRPKYKQREVYSGYKKQHVVKYQSVVFLNGIIGRLDGPYIGRRHDAVILKLSNISEEFSKVFVNSDGTWFAVYGDPGYSNQKFIKTGFRAKNNENENELQFNRVMSSLRVSVEYGFGKI